MKVSMQTVKFEMAEEAMLRKELDQDQTNRWEQSYLFVLEYVKHYINGTGGCAIAAHVYDETSGYTFGVVEWGGYVKDGYYYSNEYERLDLNTYKEAVDYLEEWSDRERR